jgi:acyl carrier protein
MTTQEIENILIQGISSIKNMEELEIAPERSFHELGIDSLGFVEILVFIEKTFKLELIASDLAKQDFESVHSLALFISRNL